MDDCVMIGWACRLEVSFLTVKIEPEMRSHEAPIDFQFKGNPVMI
jgi:hypothetical protein